MARAILLLLLLLLPLLAVPACRKSESAESDLFADGRRLVTEGKYAEAAPVLAEYLRLHPSGKHASRAGLFLGKTYVGLGKYPEARAAWERTSRNHASTLEGHKCRYKLAWLSMIEGDREAALAAFTAISAKPDGPLAPEAAAMCRFLRTLAERDE